MITARPAPAIAARTSLHWRADWRISVAILTALWAVIYTIALSWPALLDDVDTVHAEAAREMLQRHDWVTLYTDGLRYLEKSPLMYWTIAASYKAFGISNWSTRLPLVLAVLALALAAYRLGRRIYGETGGLYTGVALITSLGLYVFTRFLIPEVLVALWLTLGFDLFLGAFEEERPSRLVCWGFALTCALNVLTKGLIGLVFPIGAIGLFLLLICGLGGGLRRLGRMHLVSSTVVFLIVAAPWHILAALRNPPAGQARGFLWFYFINEHVMRFLGKRVPAGYDTVPLLLFWAMLVIWLLPWCAFLPQALRGVPLLVRRSHPSRETGARWMGHASVEDGRSHPSPQGARGWMGHPDVWGGSITGRANLLFFLWAIVIVGFFSFSTRQEYYTIPALPALALLVGGWLARESSPEATESDRRAGRASSAALLVIGVFALIAGSYFLAASHTPPPGVDLADLLKANPDDYNFSLGHVFDLTPRALGLFRLPMLGATLALFLGTGGNWLLRRRNRPAGGNIALTAMMVVLLACIHVSYGIFSPILSSYNLAKAIESHYHSGDLIVIDGPYDEASTLNFYTGVQVHILHEPSGNTWYGAKFPDAPHVFETPQSLAALWNEARNTNRQIFVWTDQTDPPDLHGLKTYLLARSGGKSVVTNRPPGSPPGDPVE